MKYNPAGKSPLRLSAVALGAMMFGHVPDDVAHGILDAALDAGVNHIDTANIYNEGRSEAFLGRWAAEHPEDRARVVIATKVGQKTGPGPNDYGLSGLHVRKAAGDSLRRLGGRIDVLYMHKDHGGPLREALSAIAPFLRSGDVGGWAMSNFSAWRAVEAVGVAADLGLAAPVLIQPCYSAADRVIENELLPMATAYGIGVVSYSPLARGILTGKYGRDLGTVPEGSRAAGDGYHRKRLMESDWQPETGELAADLCEVAGHFSVTPTALAVAWVLRNRAVTSVLAGPSRADQLADYIAALAVPVGALDAAEAIVNAHAPAGHRTSSRWADPVHPVLGRVLLPDTPTSARQSARLAQPRQPIRGDR